MSISSTADLASLNNRFIPAHSEEPVDYIAASKKEQAGKYKIRQKEPNRNQIYKGAE